MSTLALQYPVSARRVVVPHPTEEAVEGAVEVVAMHFPAGELSVLEATGGGRGLLSRLRGARFTSVDLAADADALDRLRTFDHSAARHQVAVCDRVLERLSDPLGALRRLVKTLAPGGLLVVSGATPGSLAGLLTRLGLGEDRRAMRLSAGPDALKDQAAGLGLELVYEALTPSAWPGAPLATAAWNACTWALRIASAGLWRPDLTDMVLVFRRD